jgi:hypothetical protein
LLCSVERRDREEKSRQTQAEKGDREERNRREIKDADQGRSKQ